MLGEFAVSFRLSASLAALNLAVASGIKSVSVGRVAVAGAVAGILKTFA